MSDEDADHAHENKAAVVWTEAQDRALAEAVSSVKRGAQGVTRGAQVGERGRGRTGSWADVAALLG